MSGLQLGVALGIFLLIVYKIFIKPLNNPLNHLPAPEQGPAHKRLLVEPNGDQLAEWAETIPNDGFIRYQGIFNSSKVLVTDPNAFNEIFTTQCYSFIKPPPISNLIRSVLGNGIVVTEGDAHKSQKKAIQPAFKVQNLRNFYPIFERKVEELLDILSPLVKKSTADGTSLDLGTRLHQATLDMIGLASFGKDFSCMKDPSNKLASNYMLGFVPSASAQKYRLLALFLPEAILNRVPLKRNQELRTAVTAVRECASDEIEKRYAAMEKLEKQPSGSDSNDILGTVMTESGVTDKEALINQSLTILGAGHDTIHVSIQGAIWELVKDQKIQDRLRSEVRQYYESGSSDIDSLPYLQAVLDETLRLHHAVPMMHRRNIEDVVVAGQAFPKGTNFKFSFRAFNRSPRLWKSNPEQFDPQRWMEDPALGGAKNKNAFMTFSSGARICIGQRFARAELKYLLAGLVAKYKFTWAGTGKDGKEQKLTLEHGTTSRMIGGLWVKMEPVEGQ